MEIIINKLPVQIINFASRGIYKGATTSLKSNKDNTQVAVFFSNVLVGYFLFKRERNKLVLCESNIYDDDYNPLEVAVLSLDTFYQAVKKNKVKYIIL